MPKEEWGVKRVCPTTGKRFYDLNRRPIVSPYSGEVVELEQPGRKSTVQPRATVKAEKRAPVVDEIDTDDDLLAEEEDDAVDVDDDLLEDDDDDTVALDDLADVADEDET